MKTNIRRFLNITALKRIGRFAEADIYTIIKNPDAEAKFLHFLLDKAEKDQDKKLEDTVYAMIGNLTSLNINPKTLI